MWAECTILSLVAFIWCRGAAIMVIIPYSLPSTCAEFSSIFFYRITKETNVSTKELVITPEVLNTIVVVVCAVISASVTVVSVYIEARYWFVTNDYEGEDNYIETHIWQIYFTSWFQTGTGAPVHYSLFIVHSHLFSFLINALIISVLIYLGIGQNIRWIQRIFP